MIIIVVVNVASGLLSFVDRTGSRQIEMIVFLE